MDQFLRNTYVSAMHALRGVARRIGVLKLLEKGKSRRMRWLRSLFAIYDFEDLTRLDLPWWTFDAVEAVEAHLAAKPEARVFEWGAGASTVWLSKRAGTVFSVEHDPVWEKQVKHSLAAFENVDIRHVPAQLSGQRGSSKQGFEGLYFDDYVRAIRDVPGKFDLIVIDGRAREACLEEARARLAPGGIILLDDFKRERYQAAAVESGLMAKRCDGLAVCLPMPDSTALLSRV